jgi:hypothetical protein
MNPITTIARTASTVAAAPVRIGVAVLGSVEVARRDPAATRLRTCRHDGWTATEVVLARRGATVVIERDGQRDEVAGETLAYAAYAARVAAAAGVPLRRSH